MRYKWPYVIVLGNTQLPEMETPSMIRSAKLRMIVATCPADTCCFLRDSIKVTSQWQALIGSFLDQLLATFIVCCHAIAFAVVNNGLFCDLAIIL